VATPTDAIDAASTTLRNAAPHNAVQPASPAPPAPRNAVPPALRNAVLAWYEVHGRTLAFRTTTDPYGVLVSELMAQQTQAARAAQAWTAWMRRFPTVGALAAASTADVVRAWAGLGYNRRAVNLHRSARAIAADHGGRVPNSVETLMTLPGVGPYTARAVAAIAFGVPVGAVDTNVRRVLGRVVAGGETLSAAEIQRVADRSVPEDRAGDWTHALMDIGAGPCRPVNPECAACPAQAWCRRAATAPRWARRPAMEQRARARDRGVSVPFESTRRWLRGRIVARARDAADGSWSLYRDAIGGHKPRAVREALMALAAEGVIEVRETEQGIEGRLPTG
jgi:A/G-specific adenine glycosylase